MLYTLNFVEIFAADKCGAILSALEQLSTQRFLLCTIQNGTLVLTRAYASLEVKLFPNDEPKAALLFGAVA